MATSVNRSSDKYQRILDAAVAVFAEKGFFTSRVADIADRANVADGTVYLYFKSKDEILMTAINTAFDAFMSLARTELKKLSDPAERLRRLALRMFRRCAWLTLRGWASWCGPGRSTSPCKTPSRWR